MIFLFQDELKSSLTFLSMSCFATKSRMLSGRQECISSTLSCSVGNTGPAGQTTVVC